MTGSRNFAAGGAPAAWEAAAARSQSTQPTQSTQPPGAGRPATGSLRPLAKAQEQGKKKSAIDTLKSVVFLSDIATAAINTAVGGYHLDAVGAGVDVLASFKSLLNKPELPPNPFLESDGQRSGRSSPETLRYLRARARKKVGGGIFGALGLASSSHTAGINVHKLSTHVNALSTTTVHLIKLRHIMGERNDDEDKAIVEWVNQVIRMKQMKMGRRVINTAVSSIPGAASAGDIDSIVTTIIGGGLTMEGVGTPLHQGWQCYAAAAGLHWFAFQEHRATLRLSGSLATRTICELFEQRGATRLFTAKYSPLDIIREPAGWLAIGDKLMLA